MHITSWVLALILLIAVVMLQKQGKAKAAKIVHMILRLDYLLILYSGGDLFAYYMGSDKLVLAIVKLLAGVWVIAAMEMIAVKLAKNKPTGMLWGQLVVAIIVTLILGFGFLPIGV